MLSTELAGGGCLSAYRWNGGGNWKGRTWNQDLPSDPQIVLHLLCTYLDSHLPLSPLSPDRPFSSHYLLKFPDRPGVAGWLHVATAHTTDCATLHSRLILAFLA